MAGTQPAVCVRRGDYPGNSFLKLSADILLFFWVASFLRLNLACFWVATVPSELFSRAAMQQWALYFCLPSHVVWVGNCEVHAACAVLCRALNWRSCYAERSQAGAVPGFEQCVCWASLVQDVVRVTQYVCRCLHSDSAHVVLSQVYKGAMQIQEPCHCHRKHQHLCSSGAFAYVYSGMGLASAHTVVLIHATSMISCVPRDSPVSEQVG